MAVSGDFFKSYNKTRLSRLKPGLLTELQLFLQLTFKLALPKTQENHIIILDGGRKSPYLI